MPVNIIDRSKLSGLIPEPVTREIIQGAVAESAGARGGRAAGNRLCCGWLVGFLTCPARHRF